MANRVEVDFITEAGLRAVVLATDLGHRCGYVAVTSEHPLHGKLYSDRIAGVDVSNLECDKMGVIPLMIQALNNEAGAAIDAIFNVHGSITYSSAGDGKYPIENDENLWWFGFDAAHVGDAPDPELMAGKYREAGFRMFEGGLTRTCNYMMDECESLARQLVEFKMPGPLALEHNP